MKKTFRIIVNPKSGKGAAKQVLKKLQDEARSRNVQLDVRLTDKPGHAEEIAGEPGLENIDAVIAVGGDGTLHEVINGLYAPSDTPVPPVGILAAGTGNALMTDLGETDPAAHLNTLFSGKVIRIDLFKVSFDDQTRYGFNMLGCGLPARINNAAESSRMFKGFRYEVGVCKSLIHYRPGEVEVRFPQSSASIHTDFLIAANTRNIGNGICIAPNAKLHDGLLDVLTLSRTGRRTLLSLWAKVMQGTHLRAAAVTHQTAAAFSVHAPEPQALNLDGELYSFSNLTCTVLPGNLQLLHTSVEEPER